MSKSAKLPNKLDKWTLDTVINLVKQHEFEPGIFDYKSALNPTGPEKNQGEHLDSIRRTVCSMANTNGGFILFGIRDRMQKVASPEDRLVGIPIHRELLKQFGDKVADIQPEVYFEAIPHPLILPHDPDKGVFIVYIPQSQLRPHMVSSKGIYYRRGEGGKAEIMNHYEIREQMMYSEDRLRRVALLRFEVAAYRQTIAMQFRDPEKVRTTYSRFDTGTVKILLADISGLLPKSIGLIEGIIEITIIAKSINELMNSVSYLLVQLTHGSVILNRDPNIQTFSAQMITELMAKADQLDRKCASCELLLEHVFGPLRSFKSY